MRYQNYYFLPRLIFPVGMAVAHLNCIRDILFGKTVCSPEVGKTVREI